MVVTCYLKCCNEPPSFEAIRKLSNAYRARVASQLVRVLVMSLRKISLRPGCVSDVVIPGNRLPES